MKKIVLSLIFNFTLLISAYAGGLMTNTNYHIAFDRMMARGASYDIDAIYSNPAGLSWGHEGWQLSFNWQNPHQWRNVEETYPDFYGSPTMNSHKFKGKAEAPFVPGLFASYRHDRWSLGAMIGIVGSGGTVTFKNARVPVEVAAAVPLDRLLLETDAPYLSPVPHRGKRNDSRNIAYTAQRIAAIRGMDAQELIDITTENAKRLYGIK